MGKSLNQNKSILNGKICTRLLHVIELFVSKLLTIYVSDEIRRNSVQLFYCAGAVQVFIFAFNLSYQFEYLKAGKCFFWESKKPEFCTQFSKVRLHRMSKNFADETDSSSKHLISPKRLIILKFFVPLCTTTQILCVKNASTI